MATDTTLQTDDLTPFVESMELALQDNRAMLARERDDHKRAVEAWAKERAELLQDLERAGEFSKRLPHSGRKIAVKCDDEDLLVNFEAEIAKELSGMKIDVEEPSYTVDLDVTDCQAIPVSISNCHASGGGCDGEHAGRCKPCCQEWSIRFSARLSTVWSKTGRTYARYSVELE